MKRSLKNIILIIIIVLSFLGIGLTIYYAKNNPTINSNLQSNMEMGNETPSNMNDGSTPPEMPDGESSESETPPEKPDGESEESETPPEKPDGESSESETSLEKPDGESSESETPPDMPSGNSENMGNSNQNLDTIYYVIFGIESLILSSSVLYLFMSKFNKKTFKETFGVSDKIIIFVLSVIILTGGLTFGESKIVSILANNNSSSSGMPQEQNSNVSYSSPNEITEATTLTSGEYTSSNEDENAILVSGDIEVSLANISVTKTGDSAGGDNTSFYGTNSAVIAKDGANLTLKNIDVETNATGANGVFSFGGYATTNNSSSDGTTITISDSKISTTKDNSGGIMTTGGGTMIASNLTISTAGVSSAAIRTDRGGGTVNVDGGSYTTTGAGSPTIYSTAIVTVKNATLVAKVSEGVVIEGKNKVTLENVKLTDTNSKLNGQSTTYKNIFLYQSMSGDADEGVSEFVATDSTITTNKGDSFYVTNTNSKITLTNNKITNNDATGNFLRAQKDSWGNSGSNGGNVELLMSNQEAVGNIVIDEISTLDMTMEDGSYYEGIINGDNSAKSIKLTLDKTSKIKLTGDSYISELSNSDETNSNIDFNGYKLYVNGKSLN